MILKKPYAFLIKYFKLIHLGLVLLLCYIAYKTSSVLSFFIQYINNDYTIRNTYNLAFKYTPLFLFIVVLLVIIVLGAMYWLLFHKKKPTKLYLFLLVYYTIIFFSLFYLQGVFNSFAEVLVTAKTARAIRDFAILFLIPQFVFILIIFLRAVGFDVKKFDFKSDIKELNLSAEDAEEFELNFKFDSYKIKKNLHRISREFGYYVKENKFVVICISVVVTITLGYFIISNIHHDYDKTYHLKDKISYHNSSIIINDAIITNLDYRGNVINGKYYLVINTSIQNKNGQVYNVDYNEFKVKVGNKLLTPIISLGNKFLDFSYYYVAAVIPPNTLRNITLVYELDRADINYNMKMVLNNGTVKQKKEEIIKYIYVNLKPKIKDNVELVKSYNLNDRISLEDTYLNASEIAFQSYEIKKTYFYQKEEGVNDVVTAGLSNAWGKLTLLIVQTNLTLDNDTMYYKQYNSLSSFAENFVSVQYKIGDQIYTNLSRNVTPGNANSFIALEVPEQIKEASIIQLLITIRDKKYIVNLKS